MIGALNIAVLVFQDVEPLDAIGPLEVFGAAALLMQEAAAGCEALPSAVEAGLSALRAHTRRTAAE